MVRQNLVRLWFQEVATHTPSRMDLAGWLPTLWFARTSSAFDFRRLTFPCYAKLRIAGGTSGCSPCAIAHRSCQTAPTRHDQAILRLLLAFLISLLLWLA